MQFFPDSFSHFCTPSQPFSFLPLVPLNHGKLNFPLVQSLHRKLLRPSYISEAGSSLKDTFFFFPCTHPWKQAVDSFLCVNCSNWGLPYLFRSNHYHWAMTLQALFTNLCSYWLTFIFYSDVSSSLKAETFSCLWLFSN